MYTLLPLPYSYDDLEPYIDTHTIGLHYHKHQQNYLNKLNELLQKNNCSYRYPIEELGNHLEEFSKEDQENILFQWGGVVNHNVYFRSMAKDKTSMSDALKEAIDKTFGSLDKMKTEWKKQALALKGSGYVFLVQDKNDLKLVSFQNQDTPYRYGMNPLLALDLWEHAYYLNYENKKDLYIDNFFEVLDFYFANQNFK